MYNIKERFMMVAKNDLKDLKNKILVALQGYKYFYLQRENNRDDEKIRGDYDYMLRQIDGLLMDITKCLSPNEYIFIPTVQSVEEANKMLLNDTSIIYNSVALNDPSRVNNDAYVATKELFDNDELAKVTLAAGYMQLYKSKIERLTGPNLSCYSDRYRIDLERYSYKTSEQLKTEMKERANKIYTNKNIPLEERRNLIQAIRTIYECFEYEIDRVKRIEEDPNLDSFESLEDREREENSRKVHL